ncbi:MAG: hypothetical protein RI909_1358, partial [Bacteroidota bacterium]
MRKAQPTYISIKNDCSIVLVNLAGKGGSPDYIQYLCKKLSHTVIHIGQHQDLTILRHTTVGLYLGDDEGDEDVLLPNKYCPENFELGDKLNVFVYRDYEERKIATNLM